MHASGRQPPIGELEDAPIFAELRKAIDGGARAERGAERLLQSNSAQLALLEDGARAGRLELDMVSPGVGIGRRAEWESQRCQSGALEAVACRFAAPGCVELVAGLRELRGAGPHSERAQLAALRIATVTRTEVRPRVAYLLGALAERALDRVVDAADAEVAPILARLLGRVAECPLPVASCAR